MSVCMCKIHVTVLAVSLFLSDYSLVSIEDSSPPQLVVHRLRDVLVHLHVQLVEVLRAQLKQLLVQTDQIC